MLPFRIATRESVALLVVGFLASACAAGSGQFDSWSYTKAEVPSVEIVAPAADVPANMARLSGIWSGYYCWNRNTDLKLAVSKVTSAEAEAVFATGYKGATSQLPLTLKKINDNAYSGVYTVASGGSALVELSFAGPDILAITRTRLNAYNGAEAGSSCEGYLRRVSGALVK